MKGITIRQPWAWAVAEAAVHPTVAKTVENRSGSFPSGYRGPLLIHAGRTWSRRGGDDERVKSLWVEGATWGMVGALDPAAFPTGAVIAVAELADVHPDGGCCRPWGESEYQAADGSTTRAVTHLVVEDVRRLGAPIPWRGALGLWTVPAPLAEAVRFQQQADAVNAVLAADGPTTVAEFRARLGLDG